MIILLIHKICDIEDSQKCQIIKTVHKNYIYNIIFKIVYNNLHFIPNKTYSLKSPHVDQTDVTLHKIKLRYVCLIHGQRYNYSDHVFLFLLITVLHFSQQSQNVISNK